MNRLFVINPYSGKGRAKKYINRIERIMQNKNVYTKDNVYIEQTVCQNDATDIVKKHIKKLGDENLVVYAVGGDGTLNEVINATVNTKAVTVVVPCGTGNDYVKSVSNYKSGRKIIIESLNTKPKKVDAMLINNSKHAVNMINCGFDAKVVVNVRHFNKLPFITGEMAFYLSVIYTLFMNQNYNFKIRIDDKIERGRYTLVAIGKGKYCGGMAKALKNAVIDDGFLDVCIVRQTNVFQKIKLFPKYRKGEHDSIEVAKLLKGKKVTIVSNKNFFASIDGEIISTKKIEVKVEEKSINFIVNEV